jgi:hypothetical protein
MSRYISIKEEDLNTPDAIHLMDELSDTLESITGNSGRSSFSPSDVCEERAIFVIARNQDGDAVGCGAIRPIEKILQKSNGCMQKKKSWGLEQKFYLSWKLRLRR